MLVEKPRFPLKEILLFGLLPSRLKILAYRLRGARIGRNVSIGLGSVLVGRDVEIGDGTRISFGTVLRGRRIRLGRFVRIGATTMIDTESIDIDDDAKINEQVFVGGPSLPESSLKIGKRAIVMQMSFINPTKPVVIGDDTGVGGHCLIFTHGSWQPQIDGYPVTFAPVTLGKNVWLPWRVFVMPGVEIGDGATIGANSLVNKSIPAGSLAAGSPAKVIRGPDEYPRRPTPEKQDEMIRAILDEYLGYLRYNGLEVGVDADPTYHVRIEREVLRRFRQAQKQIHSLVYLTREADALPQHVDARTVVLGLRRLTEKERGRCESAGGMWLDLASRERWGSNEVGEETMLFFSRYGLRFERVES